MLQNGMVRRAVICGFVIMAAGGCSGMKYISDNYSGVTLQQVRMPDDTYRVFDKPAENRMMVTRSVSAALGQGLASGLLLGAADGTPPKPLFKAAAEQYLKQQGRTCTIVDGYLLQSPQFEFLYKCESP